MQVCYVAFWDEITLSAQESVGRRVGENPFIGKWRIVVVRELPFTDQRLNGKIPKVGRAKIGSVFLLCKKVHSLLILPVTRCSSVNLFFKCNLFVSWGCLAIYTQTHTHTHMHNYSH
jgi:hypothetical protein